MPAMQRTTVPSFYEDMYLHPLEIDHGIFVERDDHDSYKHRKRRRLSLSSDLSDQAILEERRNETEELKRYAQKRSKVSCRRDSSSSLGEKDSLSHILGQLDLQPDLLHLIHLCKAEEDRRREEETKMKIKEMQVLHQLQSLRERKNHQPVSNASSAELKLSFKLPPLPASYK